MDFETNLNNNASRKELKYRPHLTDLANDYKQGWARYSKKVSYYEILLLAKISILLQDTRYFKNKYLR